MNKWKVIRIREDMYAVLQAKAKEDNRSIANLVDMLLRKALRC